MTSIEYDLDTSGGLMPQIQAIIAPPILEDSAKKKKDRERRYRRPGRTVNHDSCDSCKEGGDLICCDRCPAAFHLTCHDPPLSDDDLPSGDWLCHKCKTAPDNEDIFASSNLHLMSGTVCGAADISEGISFKETGRFVETSLQMSTLDIEQESANPLNVLISAAATRNPSQYQLPTELACTVQLPGSSKRLRPREANRCSKKMAHELDNGLLHLPAKLCYQCKRSCRKAPLIQCDYCPLLFHADCLDPPLTTLPTGRWMCPNHAEHLVDQKMLTSVSLSERVKLWDKFSCPVSQDAVKLHFLNKVNKRNPPFRRKLKLPSRKNIVVPNAVAEHYSCPPLLLPRVTEPSVSNEGLSLMSFSAVCSTDEQNETESKAGPNGKANMEVELKSKLLLSELPVSIYGVARVVAFKQRGAKHGQSAYVTEVRGNGGGALDSNNDISSDNKLHMSNCDASPQILTKLFNNLQANFEGSEDIEVNKLDERLLHILAYQRLQQLIPKRKYVSTEEKLLGDSTADGISEIRGRAVVCPLLKQGLPVAMCYRSLHLGLGADMDICFSNYGHCNYVSGKHASIFYDEVTKRYELLNYSCYGTTVDNVVYSSDLSEKKPSTPNSLTAAVRRLAKSTLRLADLPSPITPNDKPMMSARGKQYSKPCNCNVNSSSLVEGNGAGWEGTALLHHGSYIKCGCLQFVFSVTEYGFRIENVKEKDFLPNIFKKAS
ncbi:PHD finger protein 12-like [Stegodyphus dumicola]|nr:PHD finger protein 12-like [Stegodyphus dumicola]